MSPVALITGGARGIGAATAHALSQDGWHVALVDACSDDPGLAYSLASRADLDSAVAACGDQAIGVIADARDQADIDKAVAKAVDRFDRLDAVISAAGAIAGGADAWETDDVVWQTMLDINLTAPWRLLRAAVPHLIRNGPGVGGRVVVIASAASRRGLPKLGAYVAAKHGVIGLVKSLALELGPHGITANAVCPGSTRTAMLDASAAVYELESVEGFINQHALGRLIEPEEIAAAVAWLCSPSASAVTGAILPVDAGMTAT